ncbi:MAG: hypothetical protein J7J25_00860 [Candidatus Omnitrophica bacterium]|nr:hypothetical protein [Candidatus Omnitrophota bacterium]
MEEKLDNLIARIKERGIEEGKRKREEIIEQAKAEAKKIVLEAQAEALRLESQAKKEAAEIQQQTKDVLIQAKRDIMLQLKQEIKNICSSLLKREISSVWRDDFLKELIIRIVDNWLKTQEEKGLEIVLSQKAEALRDFILNKFQRQAKGGMKVILSPQLEKGFYIKAEGEDYYYDFSDESLAEILSEYLSPKINEIISASNG